MTHASSEEEIKAMRSDFGLRLSSSMAQYGPLCVGIDPHRKNLTDWGYNVDAEGAELFSMRMLQAMRDRAAAVKFQEPMFERYGSKGFAALERVLYAARQMGIITIVDCLHGGLSTTISAIADAYFKPGAPLLADAITLLPYYGARSLRGLTNEALNNGRGVFIASLTSNQEGASMQTAIRQSGDFKGKTVAFGIASTAQKFNDDIDGMGSVGLIIGATIGQWIADSGVDPAKFTGPILSPGLRLAGRQGQGPQNRLQRHQGQRSGDRIPFHRRPWARYFRACPSHRGHRHRRPAGALRSHERRRGQGERRYGNHYRITAADPGRAGGHSRR